MRTFQTSKTYPHQQVSGLTLTELVIVALLVGVVGSLALVSFGRNIEEERLKSASKATTDYLKTTLIYARQSRQSCTVALNHTTSTLSVANPNDCTDRPSITLTDAVEGLEDLTICGSSDISKTSMTCDANNNGSDLDEQGQQSNQTLITFTPRGSASQGGLVKLHSAKAKRTRCLAVTSPIGLIREGREQSSTCDFTGG